MITSNTLTLKNRSVITNTAAQLFGRTVTSGLIFMATIILARLLGISRFGEFTKITTYLAIFSVLADLGMNPVFLHLTGTRFTDHWPAFLTLRLWWGVILSLAATTGILLLTRISSGFTSITLSGVVVGGGVIVGYAIFLTTTAIFQARRRYDIVSLAQILGSVATVGLLIALTSSIVAAGERGVVWAVAVVVAGGGVSALVGLWRATPHPFTGLWRVDREFWQKLIRNSIPLGATLIFNSIYFRAPILILAGYRSNSEVGAYGLAFKFFEFAIAPATFFMNSLYPELLTRAGGKLWQEMKTILWELAAFSLIIALGLWIAAPLLTRVRPEFAASVGILRNLSVWVPFFFLTSPLMFLSVILKKQAALLMVYALATCLNLGLNITLIPRYGSQAAIVVTGLTELVVVVVGWLSLRRK